MKDIKGYEGLYAITTCGKVWSYRSKKFLRPSNDGRGYLFVGLCKNGTRKQYRIHRLVAEAYIPNPDNLPEVNHKDENKEHNYIGNLEWCDRKYNCNYGTRTERQAKAVSKPVFCLELNRIFESATTAGKVLGLYQTHITSCCKGSRKTHGSYHWSYMEV